MSNRGPLLTTFSIVGYDPEGPAWGIAIASRFLAVGAQTCWGAPNAGVVDVQAHLNTRNAREGLALLQQGHSATEVMQRLMAKDPHRTFRQTAIVDARGGVATETGPDCTAWAGGLTGRFCAAQGNMLHNGDGCMAMVEHFGASRGFFARRLVDALTVGDEVGGDFRGRQSAALYVIRPPLGEPSDAFTEPTIDLRVDDHDNPFAELGRLLGLWVLLWLPTAPDERMAPDEPTVRRFQRVLGRLGYYSAEPSGTLDEATLTALNTLALMRNFRRRLARPRL